MSCQNQEGDSSAIASFFACSLGTTSHRDWHARRRVSPSSEAAISVVATNVTLAPTSSLVRNSAGKTGDFPCRSGHRAVSRSKLQPLYHSWARLAGSLQAFQIKWRPHPQMPSTFTPCSTARYSCASRLPESRNGSHDNSRGLQIHFDRAASPQQRVIECTSSFALGPSRRASPAAHPRKA